MEIRMDARELERGIRNAIGAHGAWKMKLNTAIKHGHSDKSPEQLRDCTACEFGQWIGGPQFDGQIRSGKPYYVVSQLHKKFHEAAADVLEHAVKGDRAGAEKLMETEFKQRSEVLKRALMKWDGEARAGKI
jgi:hypothetical protein